MARSSATTRSEGMNIDRPAVNAGLSDSVDHNGVARKLTANRAPAGKGCRATLEPSADLDVLGLELEAGFLRLLEQQDGEVLPLVFVFDRGVDERTRELDDG